MLLLHEIDLLLETGVIIPFTTCCDMWKRATLIMMHQHDND